jgi:hypothetical protein
LGQTVDTIESHHDNEEIKVQLDSGTKFVTRYMIKSSSHEMISRYDMQNIET